MTDSGIAQLAYIPRNWSTKRLRHISPQLGVGVVVNPSSYVTDDGVPFLFGSNIHQGEFDLTGVRRMSVADSRSLPASMLRAGDLVTVRVGAPGVTAVIPQDLEGCNCASVLIIRRSVNFQSQWLCYAMNSAWGKYQVKVVQYGAAQEQFNVSHALNFTFPVPPLEEQHSIVAVLNSATRSHRALTSKTEAQVALLREYRAALISAAVTGQLDIRKHEKKLEAL